MSERDPVNLELEKYDKLKSLVRKIREFETKLENSFIGINDAVNGYPRHRELWEMKAELDEMVK